MHYLVEGESIEQLLAGKTPDEMSMYVGQIIKPSLEALSKLAEEKKVVGGVVAGARGCDFIIDVESNEEVGRLLRSFPFWRHEVDRLAPAVIPIGNRPEPRKPSKRCGRWS